MYRHLEPRQRRDRDLEQPAALQVPLERAHRPEGVLPRAEERASLLLLLGSQVAGREEIGASERIQQVREDRRVVLIAAPQQGLERALRQAESRAAEAARPHARRRLDRVLGLAQLLVELRLGIEVQPGLVPEAVVADLVSRGCDGAQGRPVLLECRVLSDDEEADREPARGEELEDARHDRVEVGRMRLPPGVAMRLHVRPLVVEVERKARVAHQPSFTGSPFSLSERCAASSTFTTRSPSWPSLTGCLRVRTHSTKWRHSICNGSPTLI